MNTILVAYDDTDASKKAARRAAEIARAFGAAVHVTSVAPVLVGGPRAMGPYDPTDTPAVHDEQLEHAKAFFAEQGITVALDPATGDPAEAILETADRIDADLIVLGSHERSLVEHALGMSVSGTVSRKTHCDVLIVH